MERRAFLKMGFAASGVILATASMPFSAAAKGVSLSLQELGERLDIQSAGSACGVNDACVIIDPGVFGANIDRMKKDIGPDVKLCIVMKSDAYGHGVENLMREALRAAPAYIGLTGNNDIRKVVACMDEAGERTAILRIAPGTFFESAEAVVNKWPVEEVVGSLAQAEMLSRIARWVGEKRGENVVIPAHINIDTGMGRMGFVRTDDVKKAMALPGIKVRGVMTHYANAYDLERGEELTRKQLDKFDAALSELKLPDDVIIHTANSGATLRFPWTRRNMVRTGGALYGDLAGLDPNERYRKVMASYRSSVVWLMEVPPNTPVGYDSVYHTPPGRPSILATVKIGYNNGFPVLAYEKDMDVLIRGRRFPIVGKTSMNMVVADVSGQDHSDKVRLGDEAVIFGKQGDQEISWDELESATGIPTCEIMLLIGNENPRITITSQDK